MIKNLSSVKENTQLLMGLGASFIILMFLTLPIEGASTSRYAAPISFVVLASPIVVGCMALIKNFRKKRWLTKREALLAAYAAESGLTYDGFLDWGRLSPTILELGHRDQLFAFCYGKDNWTYGRYSYAVYQKTRSGEYKAETIYHAICMATLPRQLPNLFFDAKATEGREYRHQFNGSQRQSLEGDFDTYFDSYFPVHYTLDSLSFITPEVMEAMIAAKEYDIEIAGSNVYLYAPLRPMPDQLIEMSKHIENIRVKLLNNIVTYRDQRLDYADGRKFVSGVGLQLRRSLTNYYFGLIIGSILTLILLVAIVFGQVFLWQLAFFGPGLTIYGGYKIHKEHAYWRYLDSLNKTIS